MIYRVGGCVRDQLLGIPSNDIDYCYVCSDLNLPMSVAFEQMKTYMIENNFKIFLITEPMLTIRAKFPSSIVTADFVLARKDVAYKETSRTPTVQLGTLYDDLVRRDFTVNAMCFDQDDKLIDLFNGQTDLKNKILRTPLDAVQTMLDDPNRVLRAMRFSVTKGFSFDEKLFEAMINPKVLEKLFKVVSKERIREELFKMMKHDTAKSLKLIYEINNHYDGFIDKIFNDGLWLKPSMSK